MNDFLSILCSNINIAVISKRAYICVPSSRLVLAVLNIMYRLGYISNFKLLGYKIMVYFKYIENKSVIRRLIRLSTPGGRLFMKVNSEQMRSNRFHGFTIFSTSKGLLTDQECLFYNIGGEALLIIT